LGDKVLVLKKKKLKKEDEKNVKKIKKTVKKPTTKKETVSKKVIKKSTKKIDDEISLNSDKKIKKTVKKTVKKTSPKTTEKKTITKKRVSKPIKIQNIDQNTKDTKFKTFTVNIDRQDLAQDHDELKLTRFETGGHTKHTAYSFDKLRSQEIPYEYGFNKAILLPVDPVLAFAYWEIREDTLLDFFNRFGFDKKLILRIYDVTNLDFDGKNAHEHWDIEIYDRVGSWYIRHSKPDRTLLIELGLRSNDNSIAVIARSMSIYFPRNYMVAGGKIKWMLVDEFGNNFISDVEEYTNDDLRLLEQILGKDRLKKILKGELSFTGGGSHWARIPSVDSFIDLGDLVSSKFK